MNNYKYPITSAQRLVNRFKTNDPFELAEYLDIEIHKISNVEKFLGLFTIIHGHKIILINNNMPYPLMKFVIAHEIGHSVLHIDLIKKGILAADCYDSFNPTIRQISENEANAFAAEILIDNTEIENAFKYSNTSEHLAYLLETIPEAIIIKCKINGYSNIETKSHFLSYYSAKQIENVI